MLGSANTSRKVFHAAVVAACAITQGCSLFGGPTQVGIAADPNLIKIGFVGSFSGSNGGNGNTVQHGAQMAVDDINAVGVLGGKKFTLVQADDKSDPATAVLVTNTLIQQGCVALIGPNSSGIAKQMLLESAVPNKVPMISPSATSPDFSDPTKINGAGFFFRTVPSDALQGKLIAERAKTSGYKKLAIIHVDNPYGDGLSGVLETSFGDASTTLDLKYPEISDPQQQASYDYASLVTQALAFKPDAIVMIAYSADGSNIINSWVRSGQSQSLPWIFSDSTDRQDFVDNVTNESVLEGKYGTAPATAPNFVTRYKALHPTEDPGYDAGAGYDAMCLIALAAQEGKAATSAMIAAHLQDVSETGEKITADPTAGGVSIAQGLTDVAAGKDVDYDGWEGPEDFDAHGDVNTGKYVIWKITNKKVADTTEIVSP